MAQQLGPIIGCIPLSVTTKQTTFRKGVLMSKTAAMISCCLLFAAALLSCPQLRASEPALPQALTFDVALVSPPDDYGHFTVACRALSLLDTISVAIKIDKNSKIEIIKAPSDLKGSLHRERPYDFFIKGRIKGQVRRAILHLELRYRFPYSAAQGYIELNPHNRYENTLQQKKASSLLEHLQNEGFKVWTIDRAIFLNRGGAK